MEMIDFLCLKALENSAEAKTIATSYILGVLTNDIASDDELFLTLYNKLTITQKEGMMKILSKNNKNNK